MYNPRANSASLINWKHVCTVNVIIGKKLPLIYDIIKLMYSVLAVALKPGEVKTFQDPTGGDMFI